MTYRLGVDLGTTYTAAAVWVGGHAEMLALGNRALQVPTVLFAAGDGSLVVGEAAERRGAVEPGRLVREFKRRVGDTVPIIVSGVPYSPQALVGSVLRWVVELASQRQGEAPGEITVTHPASWRLFKVDLLREAVRLADLRDAQLLTEPEAAAVTYAARHGIAQGETVAVYDLGGGTFDAAVLRCEGGGFRLLGEPEGIEHLGGVDFDDAVFAHVRSSLGDRWANIDSGDPSVGLALARLRRDCVAAKEALSLDTEVSVAVVLPGLSTSVRLTRAEFEEMVREPLDATVAAMGRVLRSAGVGAEQLRAIVLIGGSSRIPLVSEVLVEQFGRPLALDNHPKHDVALGAARAGHSGGFVAREVDPIPVQLPMVQAQQPPIAEPPVEEPPVEEPPVEEVPVAEPPVEEPPVEEVPVEEVPVEEVPVEEVPVENPPVEDEPAPPVVLAPASPAARTSARPSVVRALRKHRTSIGAVLGVLALIGGTTLAINLSNDTGSREPRTPTATPSAAGSLGKDVIVWTRWRVTDNTFAVFRIRANGTDAKQLTGWQKGNTGVNINRARTQLVYAPNHIMLQVGQLTGEPTGGAFFGDGVVDPSCQRLNRPAWSETYFVTRCDTGKPTEGIYQLDLKGNARLLVRHYVREPSVSFGGAYIAYWMRTYPDPTGRLYVAAMSKSGLLQPVPLGTAADVHDSSPTWSPDGTQLLFRRQVNGVDAIFTVLVRTTAGDLLPSNERLVKPLYQSTVGARFPSWSPDGKKVVFSRGSAGNGQLYMMDVAAGQRSARPLFAGPSGVDDNYPVWFSR